MEEPFPYDRVVKDIFLHDRPRFLDRITGGKRIRAAVATELPKTLERRADFVLLVDPRELHHIEFQSHNHKKLPYRQGVDCFLLAERYPKWLIYQSVIYFGGRPMRMVSELNAGAGTIRYRLIDIREYTVKEISEGGRPADLVLATLAGDGRVKLKKILSDLYALEPEARNRALAQVSLLTGLRRTSETFKMEMNRMGLTAEIEKNAFLRDYWFRAKEEGRVEGVAQGVAQGLRTVLELRFGSLPTWAQRRIANATPEELDGWMRKSTSARSIETLLGSR